MSAETEHNDLEKEYSPSRWSQRFATAQEVTEHHVHHVTAASLEATKNIPHRLDIEYGPTAGQKLDIFGTDLPNEAVILVYVHGGYWQELSREISRYPVQPLYKAGVKTIVVGYDLCPIVTLNDIVEQIRRAGRFVLEYAEKIESRGVYFSGHSAGAHLVAKLLASTDVFENTPGSNLLQGAFLISGIYDLREIVHTTNNQAIQIPKEWIVTLSSQFDDFAHLKGRKIRIHILVGQHDSPTFKQQSKNFYKALQKTSFLETIYFGIRDCADHFDIVECFSEDENYLKSLLELDIMKYFCRERLF